MTERIYAATVVGMTTYETTRDKRKPESHNRQGVIPSHAVRMPADEWSAALAAAQSNGETLTDVIRRALAAYVADAASGIVTVRPFLFPGDEQYGRARRGRWVTVDAATLVQGDVIRVTVLGETGVRVVHRVEVDRSPSVAVYLAATDSGSIASLEFAGPNQPAFAFRTVDRLDEG